MEPRLQRLTQQCQKRGILQKGQEKGPRQGLPWAGEGGSKTRELGKQLLVKSKCSLARLPRTSLSTYVPGPRHIKAGPEYLKEAQSGIEKVIHSDKVKT